MNLKEELQALNRQMDKLRHKLSVAEKDENQAVAFRFKKKITALDKKLEKIRGQQSRKVSGKVEDVKTLAFHRALTKAEQSDMGKLKKSVRGLVVVHPLTALGREMEITEVTGFAPAKF
ncbi:MAG: YibL family ribosome-associated protein [Spongiibacteraceae bacterium]